MKNFIEVDFWRYKKHRMCICGDVFLQTKSPDGKRTICVLSDGLGSGVKANVLANITAQMARSYIGSNIDICRAANIIMKTLPVCRERKISYSTFTIADIDVSGNVKIIEYDNPSFVYMHGDEYVKKDFIEYNLPERFAFKKEVLKYYEFKLNDGDRIIFFSDGVSQSGMGSPLHPLGWRENERINYIKKSIVDEPFISARNLSRRVAGRACQLDMEKPNDDISCGVIYCREPRKTLLVTGPPIDRRRDKTLATRVRKYNGRKIISGGTTANIVSKKNGSEIKINIKDRDPNIPPVSEMKGVDLVTEGILTLTKAAEILEKRINPEELASNAAVELVKMLIDSDNVNFLVGTKINEAHQDPNMPVELGIRRSTVKKLAEALEKNYLKQVNIEYI